MKIEEHNALLDSILKAAGSEHPTDTIPDLLQQLRESNTVDEAKKNTLTETITEQNVRIDNLHSEVGKLYDRMGKQSIEYENKSKKEEQPKEEHPLDNFIAKMLNPKK